MLRRTPMSRGTGFKRPERSAAAPSREARIEARQAAKPASTLRPLSRGVYASAAAPTPAAPKLTRAAKVRQSVRDSARGERCMVRLPGVCTHDPETVIWSHARWPEAGKGGATKALDLAGCYACTACDATYDGQRKPPAGYTRADVDADWCMGHFRSLLRLAEKGLL